MSNTTNAASPLSGWRWDRTRVAPHPRATARRTAPLAASAALPVLILITLCCTSCGRTRAAENAYRHAWGAYVSGDLSRTVDEASRNAAAWANTPESPWYWQFRLLQAEALTVQGKFNEAEAILGKPVPTRPELRQVEVRRLIDRANVRPSRKAEATEFLARAAASVHDPVLAVRIKLVGGIVALNQKAPAEAHPQFLAGLELAGKLGDLYWQSLALNNLSVSAKGLQHYEEAVDFGLRALALAEKAGARRVAAAAHNNLGSVYSILGESDQALHHLELGVKMQEAIGDRPNLMNSLGELGLMLDRRGESARAVPFYERAYKLARELDRERDAARHAENLALALLNTRQWDAAAQWNDIAFEAERRLNATDMLPYLARNSAWIAYGRGQSKEAARIAQGLLRTNSAQPDMQWALHNLLGIVAASRKQYRSANREFEAALRVIDNTRSDLLNSRYRITLLSRLISFYQDYVEVLARENNDAAALRVVESSRARVLAERLGREVTPGRFAGTAALRQFARSANCYLLSFWFAPERSFAWLIGPRGVRRFQLPAAAEVEKLVTDYRAVVEHSLQDPIAAATPAAPRLWDALMAKIAPQIPRGGRVVVIPDGPLHRLNLETLVAPAPAPHYWIEDVELAVAPSMTIAISSPRDTSPRPASLLLIGAPDYTGSGNESLQGAETELREIGMHFPGAARTVYSGLEATPESYRQANPDRFTLIHFAAHAEANHENPLESSIFLSHGKLHAREVIEVPIRAGLVTISACRSAGVRAYNGEGLIGFAWAFLHAGARNVIAGLWDVSDSSSAPMMERMYTEIAAGRTPSGALREAKLGLLRGDARFRKPFYWAPFQVYLGSAL